jgi:tRNA-guanine family transglycosylase
MTTRQKPTHLVLPGHGKIGLPLVWLGQSVRTTVVTRRYPSLAGECWMVSLGDAVHRPRLIDAVFRSNIRERIAVDGPLMLDSGGFTMMMKKQSLSIETVANIYKHAQAELCITLDLPPTAIDNARARSRKYERTRENLARLVDVIGQRRLIPVVHGMTECEVEKNCSVVAQLVPNPSMVCLGGLVPLLRRNGRKAERDRAVVWISNLIKSVRAQFPRTIVHVLGAGSPRNIATALHCGADSTDSLAWRRAAGFGTIYLPGTGERFVGHRNRERANSRPLLDSRELDLLESCLCPVCKELPKMSERLSELQESYLARAAHNAFVIVADARAEKAT